MTRRLSILALLATVLVATSGCAVFVDLATDPTGRKAAFRRAQREYTKALRFADIEMAARYVHPDAQDEFLSYEGQFEGIRITDFEVGEVLFGEGEKTAEVRVTYQAYSIHSMVENKIRETQRWERIGKGNQWVVRPNLDGLVEKVVAELR